MRIINIFLLGILSTITFVIFSYAIYFIVAFPICSETGTSIIPFSVAKWVVVCKDFLKPGLLSLIIIPLLSATIIYYLLWRKKLK